MLSVGHLLASLTEKGTGVKVAVEKLSAETVAVGHRVRVIGFQGPTAGRWCGGPAVRVAQRGPSILGHGPGMRRALSDFQPQIVHVHGLWLLFGTEALRYKRRKGVPFVVSPHGMLSDIALRQKPWRKRIARMLYQDLVLTQADCLVATSDTELRHIREAGFRGPVAVIPLGIEDAAPVKGFPETGEKRILYIGRKAALKGLESLALAWAEVATAFPDWRLQIIGPDSDGFEAKLASMILLNKIPRIDLLPAVYGSAREAAFCGSQFTILPSTTENFAFTVGESLVRGLPAVATRATPWRGLEDNHCGLWVDEGSKSLCMALIAMMSLPASERYAMGRRGRDWILRDFQWPTIAEQHHQLYRWVLGQETRPGFVTT